MHTPYHLHTAPVAAPLKTKALQNITQVRRACETKKGNGKQRKTTESKERQRKAKKDNEKQRKTKESKERQRKAK